MSVRQYVGAVVYDVLPFLARTLRSPGNRRRPRWGWNRNRRDRVTSGPSGEGYCCHWEHTRDLHVARMFPALGTLLLKRMLSDWPIEFMDGPVQKSGFSEKPGFFGHLFQPEVSFVIGHRGTARLPHLLLTLQSIAAQVGVTVECVVVEQSFEQQLSDVLPEWVRYHFTKTPSADYLYNRSWALNEGVRLAQGRIVILHHGDMLVPTEYAAEMKRQVDAGYDVVNLKRFIAYLNQASSQVVFDRRILSVPLRSDEIIGNLCAGGSLGITRDAYYSIGAMDEQFVGWGGEDTEFWDRCQTLRVANHTYLPIVHLWHPSQPGKAAVNGLGASTATYFQQRMALPIADRISELRRRIAVS